MDIPADETIELASSHGDLPTVAEGTVYKILTGSDAREKVTSTSDPDSMLLVQDFSPIDIQVVSPSGKRVGKNFDTSGTYDEIPGAYYTGSDAESEFITIPNPEKGEYRILTQGTGTGSYRIEASDIVSGVDGSATESVATFHGDTTPGATGDFSATVSDSGVQDSSTLKIVEVPTGTTSSDATMGSSDNSSSSHHAKKSSGKKPAVVIATATTTENEVRPTLATNLFPNPNPETGADSGASDTTIREQGKTVSETAGDARDAGISWWHVILSIISLLIVVTLAKLAWASRKGR